MNRILLKQYSDGTPPVSYGYDSPSVPYSRGGGLTSISAGISSTSYNAYDPLGRVTSSTQTTNNQQYPFLSYVYNLASGLKSVQYPTGRVVNTAFDNLSRPVSVSGAANYASGIVYGPHGAIQQMFLGGGWFEVIGYNSRLQAESLVAWQNSTALLNLGYTYGGQNNDGDPQSHTVSGSLVNGSITQNYAYDNRNRIATASEPSWSHTYVYDDRGNRALRAGGQIADGTGSGSYTPQTPNTVSVPYDQYNRWSGAGYDNRGNQMQVGARSFTYDAEGRVATSKDSGTSSSVAYSYDGEGRRVQRVVNGVTTVYVYDAFGQLAAEYSTAPQNVGTRYIMMDPLGSVRLVTDSAGNCLSTHDYLPFGEEIPANWSTRGPCYGAADGVSQRFTGMERDTEAGLDFFGARYFSGAQGRFTSPDAPFADQFEGNPESWNLYSYGRNNRVRRVTNPQQFQTPDQVGHHGGKRRPRNAQTVSGGRSAYWDDTRWIVVIIRSYDPSSADKGTITE